MKFLLICTALCLQAFLLMGQKDTAQYISPGRRNSIEQQEKPYVILISADGFRYDYAEKYQAEKLLALAKQGVSAEAMFPSFPSKTFPNHYTLVTGMYPAHHGLINNRFYDPGRGEFYSPANRATVEDGSWYGGVPLWVLAEQQEMLTACLFWVGSEAAVKGIHPSYYYHYHEQLTAAERIRTVVKWLQLPEEKRPHLITLYLPEVDHAGHRFGPEAAETRQAVQELDQLLGGLTKAVNKTGLPVNFVFVSDHGMTHVDTRHTLSLPAAVDTARFVVSKDDVIIELHARNKKDVRKAYKNLRKEAKGKPYSVYRKKRLPTHWHYSATDDAYNRIGDLLLVADWPNIFHFSSKLPVPGRHGYDTATVPDMKAAFYAWGPAFKQGLSVPAFENVHIYPLITEILGLPYSHKIDGKPMLAEEVLRPAEANEADGNE